MSRINLLFAGLIIILLIVASCAPAVTTSSVKQPVADFMATPRESTVSQVVSFQDIIDGDVNAWYWDFGDGADSREQSPLHIYQKAGKYTVTLVVSGPGGMDVEKKIEYINIYGDKETPVVASEVVNWRDAGKYIGQNKTIEGTIVDGTYLTSSKSKPTFLNFNIPYDKYFKCLIWGGDRSKFVEAFPPGPESYLMKKRVQVTGLIEEYPRNSGIPEMILKNPAQVKLLED